MPLIKNLHLLNDYIQPGDLDLMEGAALQYKRHSSITFKIISIEKKKVTIQVAQGKSYTAIYHPVKRLVEIVKETFERFFEGYKIQVQPIPFVPSDADTVDAAWVQKQMLDKSIRLKQIASDTGIEYTQLSACINDKRALSQPMKALFWYYFLSK